MCFTRLPQQTALPANSNFWLAARAPEGPFLSYLRMLAQTQTHVASGNTTEPLCTSGFSFPFWLCTLLTALHTGLPESQISILHLKKRILKTQTVFPNNCTFLQQKSYHKLCECRNTASLHKNAALGDAQEIPRFPGDFQIYPAQSLGFLPIISVSLAISF